MVMETTMDSDKAVALTTSHTIFFQARIYMLIQNPVFFCRKVRLHMGHWTFRVFSCPFDSSAIASFARVDGEGLLLSTFALCH